MKSKTIAFIHGMFMTPLCWEQWINHYRGQGYECLAPAWPGRDKPVEALRKNHPDPQLARLSLRDVVEHLAGILRKLNPKPILIGHSMGGLIVQLLLQKDLAAGGIAIDSAPPQGVFTTQWSFIKANWPAINPFVPESEPLQMSFEHFQYAFVNTLPEKAQRAVYDRQVVPESRAIPRQSLTGVAKIDFKKPHPPLLLIAGSADNIIPAALNRTNYKKYQASAGLTDFKEFEERDHFIIGERGWEEVADYCLAWLKEKDV